MFKYLDTSLIMWSTAYKSNIQEGVDVILKGTTTFYVLLNKLNVNGK